ncbi:MAG TPA: Asp23/Gls24 family envelope stress response protein [Rubrobacteraceae bacterium]|nr:Asp23/Gls24 family envelope stress response protein [Rubrobacteraceae bacterium]
MGTSRSASSLLQSDKGTTTIQNAVVSTIAAMAVAEVDGIDPSHGGTRLPGDTSPTVGEFVGRVTGGTGRTRGISVEVGEEQTALDLTVNVIYGRPIHQVTNAVRENVIRRVESLTGLEVNEVNITVNDVTFPEQ